MLIPTLVLLARRSAAAALLAWFALAISAAARAEDIEVDTADQARGVAPRLELELGAHFAWGFGNPCRQDAGDVSMCKGGLAILGGQAVALLRPANHFALGPALAYDVRLGAERISANNGAADYGRNMWRLALEVRWYSRRVSPGGLFIAFQGGVAWLTDTLTPALGNARVLSATQTAPLLGVALGGSFVPWRGIGMSMALHSTVVLLPNSAPTLAENYGHAYAYGPLLFLGLMVNLAYGVGL